MNRLYCPELLYSNGKFVPDAAVLVNESGNVLDIPETLDATTTRIIYLPGKALLPGFVNAHSHGFQRLIRGKAESRTTSGSDFWSWRGTMYRAASRLEPQDVYDVARMAFLEMAFTGTTTVGEFHYLHNAPGGTPYEDPNTLAREIIAAARSVGLRIVLLRSAYLRSGFDVPRDSGQIRFFESTRNFLENLSALLRENPNASQISAGVAPHSVRAVPLQDLKELAEWSRAQKLPLHMHVSEQVAENAACVREHGLTPIELLNKEKILGPSFTAIHAIHITPAEIKMLAEAGAAICTCPTTERNLGDGIFPADHAMAARIPIALGSDSQAQIDPLEDARELDYHLRLQQQKRAILDQDTKKSLAATLFECATIHGARSLGVSGGDLKPGAFADFFTIDLNDISIAGHSAEDLLPVLVFSLNRSAIRDVVVNGKMILKDRKHLLHDEIVTRYKEVHQKVWSNLQAEGRN
jgi:formimidoylglutamate deiminase